MMRNFLNFCNNLLRIRACILFSPNRNFLSKTFECREAWSTTRNSSLFQKVNVESMYYDLTSQFRRTKKLNAIDVDIFVTAQKDDSFIMEVEELVHKLRLTAETVRTLPTTHHAVIRLFLQYNKNDDLVRILNDRLNYGIFPDNYCNIYMLNKFLKENDVRNAAKIAAIQMLQEDFSNTLVKYLSLYAIHRYLLSSEPWDYASPKTSEEDDEEIKVRLPYIRNKSFDEHFDLIDGFHLCGKSLILISSDLESPMNNSYRIMGLSLFNKWDELESELTQLVSKQNILPDAVLYFDSVEFTTKIVKEKLVDDEKLNKILHAFGQLKPELCIQNSLLEKLKNMLLEEIKVREKIEIESQEKCYKDWEMLRVERLNEYLAEMNTRKRLEEVQRKKDELKQKEELLYFFDNEDEIDLVVEKKTETIKKRTIKKKENQSEEGYIPPEVQKRI